MLSTDTWLKIICAMMINAVIFGFGVIAVLSTPVLADHASYAIPTVTVLSFVLAAVFAGWFARRMRLRNWGRRKWREGDLISG